LDLPGIGSFTLDAGAVIPQESDRMGQVPASGISFKNANIFTPDDALITYIKEHTGKMKSLAAADLDFYLTTGRQLLNIGKPFFIEGIGTLLKNKEGRLDFTPGDYLIPRIDELSGPERERSRNTYDEPPREEPKTSNVRQRQTLLLVLLVAGVVVVGWGGYYLYQRNNFSEQAGPENRATAIPDTPAARSADTVAATQPATDTTTSKSPTVTGALAKADTAKADAVAARPAAGPAVSPAAAPPTFVPHDPVPAEGQSLYHFVILRTPNKVHALRRYNQLLGFQLNIRMETKDSTFFKLYFPVAAAPKDTTHIKDSIADVYAANVVIEK
jgi:hypothetical protein